MSNIICCMIYNTIWDTIEHKKDYIGSDSNLIHRGYQLLFSVILLPFHEK